MTQVRAGDTSQIYLVLIGTGNNEEEIISFTDFLKKGAISA